MAPRVLIPGGYGVFGRLLARELLHRSRAEIVIAGRDPRRAAAECARLGGRAVPRALDLLDVGAFSGEAARCTAVACCAGPFQDLPRALPRAAVEAGSHWLDIADDAGWVPPVLADPEIDGAARTAERAVIPGVSTIPLVAMVLLRWCLERVPEAERARAALFIGNRNEKGAGSIGSALAAGFGDPASVGYPFGRRTAYRFASALQPLARDACGIDVECRVTLGLGLSGRVVHMTSSVLGRSGVRGPAARALAIAARPFARLGSRAGAVAVEASGGGRSIEAALVGAGQRFAVLPIAIALEELLAGDAPAGVVEASAWLGADGWLDRLRARGLRLFVRRR